MGRQPLKIAFLVGRFPAISETFILNQITGLIDAGHHVDIFAKGRPADEKIQTQVESYRLLERTRYIQEAGMGPKRLLTAFDKVTKNLIDGKREILRAFDIRTFGRQAISLQLVHLLYPFLESGPYDILHCHFGSIGLTGLMLKKMGVPGKFVVTFHGQDVSQFLVKNGEGIYQSLFDHADLLMPVSQYWEQRLIQLGAEPTRLQVHRMGIDLANFPFHPRSLHAGEKIRLLTVGRLVDKKGIRYALQAVSSLLQQHPEWQIIYNIIGNGEKEEELRRLIDELGLQERAFLVGAKTREEIQQYMLDSHIFLLPSITDDNGDQEGIPVSLMEAMATGMPILSTKHTGIPELVQDGRSGFLVPEREVAGLMTRLEDLISYPERWPEMGRYSRRVVEKDHNIHKLNQQLIETYSSLLFGTS